MNWKRLLSSLPGTDATGKAGPEVAPAGAEPSGSVPATPLGEQTPPTGQVGALGDMGLESAPLYALDENQAGIPDLALHFHPAPEKAFNNSLLLELVCASPGAEIRYALDEEDVDENGTLYDAQDNILLTQSSSVVARAFFNGFVGPLLHGDFVIRRAQWNEVEPKDQSDAVPHKVADELVCPDGWRCVGASVRGKLHAHRGLWRDDSFGLANIESEGGVWSVVAVADGAGSAALSRVGSRLACDAAIDSLRRSLGAIGFLTSDSRTLEGQDWPKIQQALVDCGVAGLEAIRSEAQRRGEPMGVFATTLLVLVRRAWNGGQLCASLQVGDGCVALLDSQGVTLLGEADHGEHSSETRFLTTLGIEAELASRTWIAVKPDLRAVMVMTDGVSDDFFPEEKRLGEVFEAILPLVQEGEAGQVLLNWLGYEKKGSSDDRTLVVSWAADQGLLTGEGADVAI